jgi:hypothetical protein
MLLLGHWDKWIDRLLLAMPIIEPSFFRVPFIIVFADKLFLLFNWRNLLVFKPIVDVFKESMYCITSLSFSFLFIIKFLKYFMGKFFLLYKHRVLNFFKNTSILLLYGFVYVIHVFSIRNTTLTKKSDNIYFKNYKEF